jgi:predicted amidohydrolase
VAARARAELADRLTVGLVQSAATFGAVDDNLTHIATMVAELGPVDLAVTPELSAHGYACDPADGWPTIAPSDPRLHSWPANARAVGVGFAQHREHGMPYNSYAVIGVDPLPVQHKLHPVGYPPWNEHLGFAAGNRLNTFRLGSVVVATLICNDMWHPIAPWAAASAGAEVLLAPAASAAGDDPDTIERTWRVILEHTARVLACYVVFVNRSGTDADATFWGGSRVIGPDGIELTRMASHEAAGTVELDMAAVRAARRDRPFDTEANVALLEEALTSLRKSRAEETRV